MHRRLKSIVLAMVVAGLTHNSWAAEAKVTKIASAEPVGQWAVEETTGRLFATIPGAESVVEYDPASGQPLHKFPLPGGPLQLLVKSHWLAVACPANSTIGLIDLKTNKVAGSVEIGGQGPTCLFCSKADNDYVYGLCHRNGNNGPFGLDIVQVECGRQAIRKHSSINGQNSMLHAVMSADGRWIASDGRGSGSPSGADLTSADEDAGTFVSILHIHQSFGQLGADPSSHWWTLGEQLFPVDLSKAGPSANSGTILVNATPLRSFAGSPVAIHPARDLAVSVSAAGDGLTFQAFSSANPIKSVKLDGSEADAAPPETPRNGRSRPRRLPTRFTNGGRPTDACLAFDLAHDRAIYGAGDSAYVFSAADEIAVTPKRITIAGAPNLNVIMEQTRRTRLALADGSRATWKLESGPAFATLAGDELVVSPKAADLGHHDVVVKATRDDISDSIKFDMVVGVPNVELGYHIQQMTLDPAGKAALVWGQNRRQRMGYDPEAANEPTQFALVDLDTLKVTAKQSVKAGILIGALDDKYVYMVLASGNVLYRMDRTEMTKPKRLFLNGQPSRIECLPGGQVAIKMTTSNPFSSTQVYDRETLTPNPKHFAQVESFVGIDEFPAIAEPGLDGTLVFREKIVDAETGETRCALESNSLPALADVAVQENFMPGRTPRTTLWARTNLGQVLANTHGSRLAQFPGIAAISPFDPLAASVRREQIDRRAKQVLEFFEIKMGEIIGSVDLGDTAISQEGPEFYNRGIAASPLQLTKDKVVYRDGTRLVACPIPVSAKKKAIFPLALKPPKLSPASVESPVEIQFAAYGSDEGRTFALTKEYPGLSIDAARGKVTIDLPKIWQDYLAGQRPVPQSPMMAQAGGQALNVGANFERLIGAPLPAGKTAFRLPLRVSVTNASGESDELRLALIVIAPEADVKKVALRLEAEQAAMQAKAQAEMMRRQAEQNRLMSGRAGEPPAASADAARINQLENRMRRIESSLDAVLEKLDRLEKASNGAAKREEAAPK